MGRERGARIKAIFFKSWSLAINIHRFYFKLVSTKVNSCTVPFLFFLLLPLIAVVRTCLQVLAIDHSSPWISLVAHWDPVARHKASFELNVKFFWFFFRVLTSHPLLFQQVGRKNCWRFFEFPAILHQLVILRRLWKKGFPRARHFFSPWLCSIFFILKVSPLQNR